MAITTFIEFLHARVAISLDHKFCIVRCSRRSVDYYYYCD